MKSFVVACGIFGLVVGLIIGNSVFICRRVDAMTAAILQMPEKTNGAPAEYGSAVQNIRSIWEKNRTLISVTVPRRITDPLERAMRAMEAGWRGGDDAMYRHAVSDLLAALESLREAEGFSLGAIV
jgi:hypothetical protein